MQDLPRKERLHVSSVATHVLSLVTLHHRAMNTSGERCSKIVHVQIYDVVTPSRKMSTFARLPRAHACSQIVPETTG